MCAHSQFSSDVVGISCTVSSAVIWLVYHAWWGRGVGERSLFSGKCKSFEIIKPLSPFLIGQMFVCEPSWEYSANLVGS